MATEEMKPETKKTEEKQSPQVKDLPPPQQQQHKNQPPSLPLPYKTCSLKVSIHCEGCRRKVKKILTSIEGVYRVDIDVKLHKATVMGIVPPEILLQKLLKAGKNALILPEEIQIPDPVENKPVTQKEKKNKKKKNEEKAEKIGGPTSSGSSSDKPESGKTGDNGECVSGDGGETNGPVKEEKKEVLKEKCPAQAETPSPADSPTPAEEKKAEESSGNATGTVSGNVGKRKKKKGQKLSAANNPSSAPARPGSPPPPTTPAAADHDRPFNQNEGHHHHILTNNSPPGHNMYHPYPPNYYAPQVMYGVSYNVAQPPAGVDGASYYTPPPPHSYAYMHPGYLPHDQNPYPSRPSDSFELFSDENPNGCSVM